MTPSRAEGGMVWNGMPYRYFSGRPETILQKFIFWKTPHRYTAVPI